MIKNSNNKKAHAFKRAAALITAVLMAALVFTGCPQPPTVQKVTITITGDANVTINEPKTLEVAKGSKWNEVKAKIKVSYKTNYEAAGFKLDSISGIDLKDDYAFNENKTVFALSKPKTNTSYKIEHLQQNIADNEYTLKETETGTGTTDTMTQAEAKNYTGFTAQEIIQAKIKADGSTVVQIKYSRNIIALKLNLTGGTTTTPLTDGEGGIKLLKGKYGAKVELKNLEKTGNIFDKWTPELPSTFPASSPDTTYAASWTNQYSITVKGDERTSIPSSLIEIDLEPAKTWHDIQGDVANKVILKPEWPGSDYEVYEWRLGDENGTKLTDDYQIKSHITVYAVTNYAEFNIIDKKIKLTAEGKGYTGEAPKGKIIIPDGITEIEDGDWSKGAFKDCTEITSVQFPQSLTKIGSSAFFGTDLTSVDLPANLTEIGSSAFTGCTALKSVDLPASLTKIGDGAFSFCAVLKSVNLPASLTSIGMAVFGNCFDLTNLTVDSGNINYKAVDNIIYTINGETLIAAAGGLKTVSILNTITKIESGAFAGCAGLTEVKLPASLTEIGWGAFYDTSLTSIDLSGCIHITKIDNNTFERSMNLQNIKFPPNLTEIGEAAFNVCTSLTGVLDLSALTSLTEIRGSAFNGCTGLAEVKLPASLTKIDSYAFSGCTSLTSAVFAVKNGWAVYDDDKYENKAADIQQSDLENAATAAKYLREMVSDGGFRDKYWKKN